MITLAAEVLIMLCDNYGMNFDRFAKIEKQSCHWYPKTRISTDNLFCLVDSIPRDKNDVT